jgi:thiol-disulfide isomerase/thioredoxin
MMLWCGASRRRRLRLVGWVLLWVLLGACHPPSEVPTARPTVAALGDVAATPRPVAHEFVLETLGGESVALADLRGRWVILNFWATWCLPCREEMPYLQEIADTYADQVTVLGINMREAAADVGPFAEATGIEFPILMQPDDAMLLWYGPRGLPLTYVIAPDGTVAYQQFGPLNPTRFTPWLEAEIGLVRPP